MPLLVLRAFTAAVREKIVMNNPLLHRLNWPTRVLLLAVAYFVTGKLGLLLAVPPGYATAVWPPSGIALGGLLILGSRTWLGVWLGSFCVNVGMGFDASSSASIAKSMAIAGSIAFGATLQAWLGAAFIRKKVGWPNALLSVADVCWFMAIAGPISCLINATWSVTTLWLAGAVPSASFLVNWATWWIGDTIGASLFSVFCLLAAGESRAVWRQRWLTVALPLTAVFIAVVAVFVHSSNVENHQRRREFESRAMLQGELIQQNVQRLELIVRTVAGHFETAQSVTRNQFHHFTRPILESQTGINGLGWNPKVTREERAAFEQNAGDDGTNAFSITERSASNALVKAGDRQEYYPIYFVEPMSRNKPAVGFDVASDLIRRQAIHRARDTGQLVATAPVTLVQDIRQEKGFLLYAPVYAKGVMETISTNKNGESSLISSRREHVRGVTVGVFNIGRLIDDTLQVVDRKGINLWVYDQAMPLERTFVYGPGTNQPPRQAGLGWNRSIKVGGRTWSMHFAPSLEYVSAQRSWGLWLVLAGGLTLTGLLCTGLLIVTGHTASVEKTVSARTRELAENEELFRSLATSSPIGIFRTDVEGRCVYTNRRWQELGGITLEESLGDGWARAIFSEDRNRVFDEWTRCARENRPFAMEMRFQTPTGTIFLIHSRAVPLHSPEGKVVGHVGTVEDITERKRVEAALQESENRLRILCDITSKLEIGVAEKIKALLQTSCLQLGLENGIFARVEGDHYQVEHAASETNPALEGLNCPLQDTICHEVLLRDKPVAFEHAAVSEWRHHPGYIKYKAEAYIGAPVRVRGKVYGALCFTSSQPRTDKFTAADIEFLRLSAQWIGSEVEHKLAEDTKRSREQKLEAAVRANQLIMENSMDVICTIDEHGQFIFVSAACEHIWGYKPEELVGRKYMDLVHPEDHEKTNQAAANIMAGKDLGDFENRYRRKDGLLVPILWSASWSVDDKIMFCVARDITEQKRVHEELEQRVQERTSELAESEQRYRFLTNTLPQIIWTAKPDGNLDYYNQRWFDYTGMTFEQTVDWGWKPVLHPDDVQNCVDKWTHAFTTGENYEVEYRFKRAIDGEYRWHLGRAFPMKKNGLIVSWVGSCTDIDDNKKTEEALREAQLDLEEKVSRRTLELAEAAKELRLSNSHLEREIFERQQSERRMELIIDTAHDAFIGMDSDGRITDWNPQAVSIFGWTREAALGRNLSATIIPPEFREAHARGLKHFLATTEGPVLGKRVELVGLRQNGNQFPLEITISPIKLGEDWFFGAFVRDISERKRSSQRLKVQFTVARVLSESSTLEQAGPRILAAICNSLEWEVADLWFLDKTANVLRHASTWHVPALAIEEFEAANRLLTFAKGIGLPGRVWASGQPVWISDLPNDPNFPRAPHATRAGLHAALAFPVQIGEELLGVLEVFSRTVHPPDDQLMQIMSVLGGQVGQFMERKQAQNALAAQAEELRRSNADLEQFAYVASHDLQEPLRAVAGCAQILGSRYKGRLDARADELIMHTVEGANRMRALIIGLLDYSRLGIRGKVFEAVDCETIVNSALENLRMAIKESGTVITRDKMPVVPADVTQLTQLFQNLIGNAIKYRDERRPQIHLGVVLEKDEWHFSVADNGIGIEPEYFAVIFGIFQRLHTRVEYSGTGIGLAVCKKIVERHGGRIWVESTLGKGSTFHFTIASTKHT